MKINLENYEAYFLDYYEKNLGTTEVAELMIFLEAHPELKPEFEEFELLTLTLDSNVVFEPKDSLKKNTLIPVLPVTGSNYQEYLVASLENMLSPEEEAALSGFISLNPGIENELALYRLTFLKPDKAIVFDDKSSLKKRAVAPLIGFRLSRPLMTLISVAAGLTILFLVYLTLQPVPVRDRLAKNNAAGENRISPGEVVKTKPGSMTAARTAGQSGTPATAVLKYLSRGQSPAVLDKKRQSGASPETSIAAFTMDPAPRLAAKDIQGSGKSKSGIRSVQRNEFSELYSYYMIRNQLEYYQNLEDQKSRSILARTVSGLRQGLFGEDEFNPNAGEEKNLGWAMADLGVRGFNALTSSELRLIRRMNPEGKTQSYAIRSDRAEYSKSLDK